MTDPWNDEDPLRAARGILNGLAWVVPFWILAGGLLLAFVL